VIDDREIWACAYQLIRHYGDGAGLHAAQRADELLAAGDFDGAKTWVRISDRIERLDVFETDGSIH
jgi:hypothetical protein